jgi:hypothetical protein
MNWWIASLACKIKNQGWKIFSTIVRSIGQMRRSKRPAIKSVWQKVVPPCTRVRVFRLKIRYVWTNTWRSIMRSIAESLSYKSIKKCLLRKSCNRRVKVALRQDVLSTGNRTWLLETEKNCFSQWLAQIIWLRTLGRENCKVLFCEFSQTRNKII